MLMKQRSGNFWDAEIFYSFPTIIYTYYLNAELGKVNFVSVKALCLSVNV